MDNRDVWLNSSGALLRQTARLSTTSNAETQALHGLDSLAAALLSALGHAPSSLPDRDKTNQLCTTVEGSQHLAWQHGGESQRPLLPHWWTSQIDTIAAQVPQERHVVQNPLKQACWRSVPLWSQTLHAGFRLPNYPSRFWWDLPGL